MTTFSKSARLAEEPVKDMIDRNSIQVYQQEAHMTMPTKGSHILDVDGQRYRWHERGPHDQKNLIVAVELAEAPRSVLIADLGRLWVDPWLHFPNPTPASGSTISARKYEIVKCIQAALAAGWQPDKPGKPFLYNAIPAPNPKGS